MATVTSAVSAVATVVVIIIILAAWIMWATRVAAAPALDQIAPGIFLGDWADSVSRDRLRRAGIGAVLTINSEQTHTRRDLDMYAALGIRHKRIVARDSMDEDITRILPEALRFIDAQRRAGRRVLIHCTAGISRSVSVVAAHLISRGATYSGAMEQIRAVRPIAQPNPAFERQLSGTKIENV